MIKLKRNSRFGEELMRKKTLRIIFCSIVLGAFGLGISACGGDPSSKESPTLNLEYTLNEDGASYTLVGIGASTRKHLVVPETYNGMPVTAIGKRAFDGNDSLVSVTLPDSILSIGTHAFWQCEELESITVGAGVQEIGDYAFAECPKLAKYSVSENNAYFCSVDDIIYNKDLSSIVAVPFALSGELVLPQGLRLIPEYTFCQKRITSVVLPDSLATIGAYAFQDCAELTQILFGKELVSIDEYAFSHCSALTEAELPQILCSIGDYAFQKCEKLRKTVIPEQVTYLGRESFASCPDLKEIRYNAAQLTNGCINVFASSGNASNGMTVKIGASVKQIPSYIFGNHSEGASSLQAVWFAEGSVCQSIGDSAFKNCDRLTEINLPTSITSIESSSFLNCASVNTLFLSDQLTFIGNNAFDGCEQLQAVSLGNKVTQIGENAFARCTNLQSISVSEENLSYSSVGGNLYDKNGALLIQYALGKPDLSFTETGASEIGNSAFEGCKNLTEITLGDTVKTVGDGAFKDCRQLSSVTLSDEITSMGQHVFQNCTALTEIALPNNLTAVNSLTFEDCSSLKNVSFGGGMSAINSYAFTNCNALESISIPKQIRTVEHSAFYHCSGLTDVYIDSGTQFIDKNSFNYCDSLQRYTVSEENGYYASQDGILYNKAKTEILVIPDDLSGEVELPEGVTKLANSAWPFRNRKNLTSLILPASLNYIVSNCFTGCASLTAVTFKQPNGWITDEDKVIPQKELCDPATAARALTDTYANATWQRK